MGRKRGDEDQQKKNDHIVKEQGKIGKGPGGGGGGGGGLSRGGKEDSGSDGLKEFIVFAFQAMSAEY